MSWFGALKKESDPREERRKQLEQERLKRAQIRADRQKQLQAAQAAQQELGETIDHLLALDPDILSGDTVYVSETEVEELLETSDNGF